MKTNLIVVPKPSTRSFTMLEDFNKELLRETKTVRVSVFHETITRLATSMQVGNTLVGINFPIEGYKTHEKTEHNYFSGNYVTKNYFVKSKKQDLECFKGFVEKLVVKALTEYLYVDIDEVTIELETANF